MKNLHEMFDTAMEMVQACGIKTGNIVEVTINTRAKKRFGQCHREYDIYKGGYIYSINISSFILADDCDEYAILDTIIHEILHTCYGCMNHGKEWKRLANIVNEEWGMIIGRCGSYSDFSPRLAKEMEVKRENKKSNYVFQCRECGQKIKRERMSDFVKHPWKYKCGKCDGKFSYIPEESKKGQMLWLKEW